MVLIPKKFAMVTFIEHRFWVYSVNFPDMLELKSGIITGSGGVIYMDL